MAKELTPEQRKLSHEELHKDVQARIAESLLKEIDTNVEVQWVKKGDRALAAGRRVIQLEG